VAIVAIDSHEDSGEITLSEQEIEDLLANDSIGGC
jgi:hypothetical protein